MATIDLNIPEFRALYPSFTDIDDAIIQMQWDRLVVIYPNNTDLDCLPVSRKQVLYLYLAHSLFLYRKINEDGADMLYPTTSASVDKVSISSLPPPVKSMRDYWLSLSPYGLEVMALRSIYTGFQYFKGSNNARWRSIY